jgi:hypothetical protein
MKTINTIHPVEAGKAADIALECLEKMMDAMPNADQTEMMFLFQAVVTVLFDKIKASKQKEVNQ